MILEVAIFAVKPDAIAEGCRIGAPAKDPANPDWQLKAKEISGGHGVDQVLDVGGRDTLSKALEILAYGGHIAFTRHVEFRKIIDVKYKKAHKDDHH